MKEQASLRNECEGIFTQLKKLNDYEVGHEIAPIGTNPNRAKMDVCVCAALQLYFETKTRHQ